MEQSKLLMLSCFAGAFNVPVILVPSLAAFGHPVHAAAVPVELSAAGESVDQEAGGQHNVVPAALAGETTPTPTEQPAASSDESASGVQRPQVGAPKAPAVLAPEAVTQTLAESPRLRAMHSGQQNTEQPAAAAANKGLAGAGASLAKTAQDRIPQLPPCPSARGVCTARRSSAPAVIAVPAPKPRPAHHAAVEAAAQEAPVEAQPESVLDSAAVQTPKTQIFKPLDAVIGGGASLAQISEQMNGGNVLTVVPRPPVGIPDLMAPQEDLSKPDTPTGQAGSALRAALASDSASPQEERTPTLLAASDRRLAAEMQDQVPQQEQQRASTSPERQSFDAESLLQNLSNPAAPQPASALAAAVAATGGSSNSCSSKNGHALHVAAIQEGKPGHAAPEQTGASLQGSGAQNTLPGSHQPEQGLSIFKDYGPQGLHLQSTLPPHQRQPDSDTLPWGFENRSQDLRSAPAIWYQTEGMLPNGGGSQGHELHAIPFTQQQQKPQQQQQPQRLSANHAAALDHDAFGPLLGSLFGADFGADPMAMDEDLALDSDLATAWHQDLNDIGWVLALACSFKTSTNTLTT